MKESLTYMFKDADFCKKAALYFVVLILSGIGSLLSQMYNFSTLKGLNAGIFLIIALFSFVFALSGYGYMISCLRENIIQKENLNIPWFNFINNFVDGFKLAFSFFLLYFSVFLIFVVLFLVGNAISGAATAVTGIISLILGICFLVVLLRALPALIYNYAVNKSWLCAFKFKEADELIKENKKHYWITYAKIVGIGLVSSIILIAFVYIVSYILGFLCGFLNLITQEKTAELLAGVVAILSSSAAYSYLMYVYARLLAQLKQTKEIEEI
ncbi:MAG: DUF4013 domain-containing protein [Candidatus Gastranaerophilales bacterium]|nr:DUF4013 domain-containing protein [Candidatus Gastranaerophilales bacterium]